MSPIVFAIIKWTIFAALVISVSTLSVRSIERIRFYEQPTRQIIVFLSVPIFEILVMLAFFILGEQGETYLLVIGILLLLGSIFVNRSIFTNIGNMLEKVNMEEEMTELYNQRQMESDYYDMVSEGTEEMRMLRHEFANQLQTAYSLLKEEDGGSKAKEVLDGIKAWLDQAAMKHYSDDPMINAILTVQTEHFAEEGINIECAADLEGVAGIRETDLYGIIHQILLYGKICLPTGKDDKKNMRFSIGRKGGFLLFHLEVECLGKYEGANHLPGIPASLKKYIDRYHGTLKMDADEKINLQIALEEEM